MNNFEHFKQLDEFVYNEIFVWNVYQVKKEEVLNHNVLDVGGHFGFFSCLANSLGAKRVIGIEANPHNALKYVKYTQDITNGKCINAAVSTKSDQLVTIDNTRCLSTVGKGDINVATITLNDAIDMFPKNEDILLKMDIEGGEYDIFYNASRETIRRFNIITIEMHGAQQMDKLNQYILGMGYWGCWRGEFFENYGSSIQNKLDTIAIYKYIRI